MIKEGIAKLIWAQIRARFAGFGFFASRLRPKGYVVLQKTEPTLRSSNLRLKASFATSSKNYYKLTKPGIVFGNALTAAAGFFLASKGNVDFLLFLQSLFGLSLVVASGCVLNNYFDRLSDQKMGRTSSRPLAKGSISIRNAMIFGFILLTSGVALLFFTTLFATLTALIGFVIYAGFYTFGKYKTVYATELGSLAGATPPLVGYTAVTGGLDVAAGILFAIVALWQMPHFFAIAIYRQKEYASASIPVLPLARGVPTTKIRILFYLIAFIFAALSLAFFGYTGIYYLTAVSLLSLYWLWTCIRGFRKENEIKWARKVFLSSLTVIVGICALIAFDSVS